MLYVFYGIAAAAGIEVPDKAVGDQAHAREHDTLLPRGLQIIQPPAPVVGTLQFDPVEPGLGCGLPLLEDVVARKDMFLTR